MPSNLSHPLVVCLTGGGTAGHVTPHFALLPGIKARGWRVFYIGSSGIERGLVEAQGIPFTEVATGKLRRYRSWRNVADVFKVALGCVQALMLLLKQRPNVVFSKGGFVAVPVAWAAWLLRIPVVSHESDVTPGLATRLIQPVAKRIVYTFAETGALLRGPSEQVGTPVRDDLLRGDRARGLKLCGFSEDVAVAPDLPTYLVMGGSQGALKINTALLEILPSLLAHARVIHLTGAGKGLAFSHPRYRGFEFVGPELKDLFAAADFVVSRAGANSIFEILSLRKPMLLIPLEQGSRGDQAVNAAAFAKAGWALVQREGDLSAAVFGQRLQDLAEAAPAMVQKQSEYDGKGAAVKILDVLSAVATPVSPPPP
ncbi:MAG: glycosyltransferase [Proteobacteria bacterium]|nr:glycosyltransferase [Pseudomonadota bacterium]